MIVDRSKGENQVKGTVLITGATGFVGHYLCERLLAEDFIVHGTLLASETPSSLVDGVIPVTVEPLGADTQWIHAFAGVNTIIHLAARVHIMEDSAVDPLSEFRKVNVAGTERLAHEAARAGVKRLVFISSIKVNGEETPNSYNSYNSDSPAKPSDPYGISKWEAEQALHRIETETDLEVVIVRPTLVYGPGVKANFLKMVKIIQRGIPLPLATIKNRRSLIYVGNLVDALVTCAVHPNAAGNTYLVSDGEDISTSDLIRRTAKALGAPERLFTVPLSLMLLAGKLTCKSSAVKRLTGSLAVDSSKIRLELGWIPPFTMNEGLNETALWFKTQKLV